MASDQESDLSRAENLQFDEEDGETSPPPSDIVSYNELRSCSDLYRMYEQKALVLQPDFQREEIWSSPARTRFVDSLMKQLPIPSLCFSLDFRTQKWQVIDGLQRISTIVKFLGDPSWQLSRLKDIDNRIAGLSVADIKGGSEELNVLYRRVENLTIPITVIRCDHEKTSHTKYLFTIFHRLNSGGSRLTNQEIRNCIYQSSFNDLLRKIDRNDKWRELTGFKQGEATRFRCAELALRFFAFYFDDESFSGGLARFLSLFMEKTAKEPQEKIDELERLFYGTLSVIPVSLRIVKNNRVSVTVLEAFLHGVAKNLTVATGKDSLWFEEKLRGLRELEEFSPANLRADLAEPTKVKRRLGAAREIFSS
jgi:hypothetical protein